MKEKIINKLNFNKHYINKSHTKHYYLGHIFNNFEWKEYINGITVQGIHISITNPYRVKSKICERWYNQDNNKTNIVKRCENKVFYKTNSNIFICKQCARAINKINPNIEFTKINDN